MIFGLRAPLRFILSSYAYCLLLWSSSSLPLHLLQFHGVCFHNLFVIIQSKPAGVCDDDASLLLWWCVVVNTAVTKYCYCFLVRMWVLLYVLLKLFFTFRYLLLFFHPLIICMTFALICMCLASFFGPLFRFFNISFLLSFVVLSFGGLYYFGDFCLVWCGWRWVILFALFVFLFLLRLVFILVLIIVVVVVCFGGCGR